MPAVQRVSTANYARAYRLAAARHLYDACSPRVLHGRLPPLIRGVLVLDMTVDSAGRTKDVHVHKDGRFQLDALTEGHN